MLANNTEMDARTRARTPDLLATLLEFGAAVAITWDSKWVALELKDPRAKEYKDSHHLLPNIKAGDQIVVCSTNVDVPYWHHGIFMGLEKDVDGDSTAYVVDVWGGRQGGRDSIKTEVS